MMETTYNLTFTIMKKLELQSLLLWKSHTSFFVKECGEGTL